MDDTGAIHCAICERADKTFGVFLTCFICHRQVCRSSICSQQVALPGFVKLLIFCSGCYVYYRPFYLSLATEEERHALQIADILSEWRGLVGYYRGDASELQPYPSM